MVYETCYVFGNKLFLGKKKKKKTKDRRPLKVIPSESLTQRQSMVF